MDTPGYLVSPEMLELYKLTDGSLGIVYGHVGVKRIYWLNMV